jgi:hypothetical protein
MNSHKELGIPVLLKPSIVINLPQKKIKREYDFWTYVRRIAMENVQFPLTNREKQVVNNRSSLPVRCHAFSRHG